MNLAQGRALGALDTEGQVALLRKWTTVLAEIGVGP